MATISNNMDSSGKYTHEHVDMILAEEKQENNLDVASSDGSAAN
ncbi:unnamed protein product [Urochloa humidicola]